nr:inorganic triphosphatase [Pseudomonadota bacterium]
MNSRDRELELKFIVGPRDADTLTGVLSAGGPPSIRTLASIYFDTASRSLWRAGFTLRLRKDGRRWTQTIKSRDGLDGGLARGEWEALARRGAPDLIAARRTPLAGALPGRARLAPLFRVTVERCSWMVTEAAGVIEISLDRGVAEARGRSAPILEVELELKSGDPDALFTLAHRLGRTIPLRLSFTTKADRGIALIGGAGGAARRFQAPDLHGEMTAGGAFRAIARADLKQIAGNVECLDARRSEEAVHQMRVGARRLRGALSTFKSVVAGDPMDRVETELKWLTGELDTVRNLDVFLAGAYGRIPPGDAGRAPLGRRLRRARGAALT